MDDVKNIYVLAGVIVVGLFLAFLTSMKRETVIIYDEEGRVVKILTYPKWW